MKQNLPYIAVCQSSSPTNLNLFTYLTTFNSMGLRETQFLQVLSELSAEERNTELWVHW